LKTILTVLTSLTFCRRSWRTTYLTARDCPWMDVWEKIIKWRCSSMV